MKEEQPAPSSKPDPAGWRIRWAMTRISLSGWRAESFHLRKAARKEGTGRGWRGLTGRDAFGGHCRFIPIGHEASILVLSDSFFPLEPETPNENK